MENSSKLAVGPSGANHEHREIYDAIKSRNPVEAANCARLHLNSAALRLNIDVMGSGVREGTSTCNDLQSKWPRPAIIEFFDRD